MNLKMKLIRAPRKNESLFDTVLLVQKIPRKKLPFIYRRALYVSKSLSARLTHESFTLTCKAHFSDFRELYVLVDVYIDVYITI